VTVGGDAAEGANVKAGTIEAGQRVRVDVARVQWSLPKAGGQLSCEGVRLQRTLWAILDSTGHRPFVTEVREREVEIASSFYGVRLRTLRVPRQAVCVATREGGR
jgi:hypothetical protein